MVEIIYIGGPFDSNEKVHRFPSVKADWHSMCEHMTGEETTGLFVVDKATRDSSGFQGVIYRQIQCEYCARKQGIIW